MECNDGSCPVPLCDGEPCPETENPETENIETENPGERLSLSQFFNSLVNMIDKIKANAHKRSLLFPF